MEQIFTEGQSFVQTGWNQLNQNEFAQGGLMIGLFSAVVIWLRSLPGKIYRLMVRIFVLELTIDEGRTGFEELNQFFADAFKETARGELIVARNGMVPSGVRWRRRGWAFFRIVFIRRAMQMGGDRIDGAYSYSLSITVFGFGRRSRLTELFDEAELKARESKEKREFREVFTNRTSYWEDSVTLPKRGWCSIYSDNIDPILDDVAKFTESESRYLRLGMPFRRGYLFFGPPGTGKTSFVVALANHLKRDLYSMDLSVKGMGSESLQRLFSIRGGIILIEDADVQINAFKDRDADEGSEQRVSLSSLLNAIDGAASGHDQIIIITSNNPQQFDEALMRPGRIDKKFFFGEMSQAEFDKAVQNFFEIESNPLDVPGGLVAAQCQNRYQESGGDFDQFAETIGKSPEAAGFGGYSFKGSRKPAIGEWKIAHAVESV